MKTSLLIATVLCVLSSVHSPAAESANPPTSESPSFRFGMNMAIALKRQAPEMKAADIAAGMKASLAESTVSLPQEELDDFIQAFEKVLTRLSETPEKNRKEAVQFMAANASQSGVITLPSGLQYKVLKEGEGQPPLPTDEVTVHYRGTLLSGREFDSSYRRKDPVTFPIHRVIKGWTEALPLMKPGAKWLLWIPPELAYGVQGKEGTIPPNSALIYEIELLSIKKPANSPK